MTIQRILFIVVLLLFVLFVAAFFSVLIRLSRVGIVTERYARIVGHPQDEPALVDTILFLRGQDPVDGNLHFHVVATFDVGVEPFDALEEGDTILLRTENYVAELHRNFDLYTRFTNPAGDRLVTIDFGELEWEILDRRDFYPFDGYEVYFNYAYHVPEAWYEPRDLQVRSLTNLIMLNPRYESFSGAPGAYRFRVARLRIQQLLAATLILLEVLFLLYLVTIADLRQLLGLALGYVVALYVIRNILVTNAPQFPTIVDYGTMFLICVAFFLLLLRFLGGTEEKPLPADVQPTGDGSVTERAEESGG